MIVCTVVQALMCFWKIFGRSSIGSAGFGLLGGGILSAWQGRGRRCPRARRWLSVCQHWALDVCSPRAMVHADCLSSSASLGSSRCISFSVSLSVFISLSLWQSAWFAGRPLILVTQTHRCLLQNLSDLHVSHVSTHTYTHIHTVNSVLLSEFYSSLSGCMLSHVLVTVWNSATLSLSNGIKYRGFVSCAVSLILAVVI